MFGIAAGSVFFILIFLVGSCSAIWGIRRANARTVIVRCYTAIAASGAGGGILAAVEFPRDEGVGKHDRN